MFAVGHLALGYLTGKASSKLLHVKVNIPLLFLASVLPDIDVFLGVEHRGPTHSLITMSLLFLPVFIVFRRRSIPYFVSIIQHSIIGDYLTGRGVQVLWPVTFQWYHVGIGIGSLANIFMEWIFFLTSLAILFKSKDVWMLFQHHPSNLLLSIPVLTVLLPIWLQLPIPVPLELIIPHLIYVAIFALSILIDFRYISRRLGRLVLLKDT